VRIQLNSASGSGDRLVQRVADMAAGRTVPVAPRNAATVMLLRSCTPDGVEVLMLRRTAAMKFAPGAYVFPGGSVDEADFSAEIGWLGPSPADFGARLGCSAELAGALVCAAVRETFEESGVLLAGTPDGLTAGLADPSWEADRMALTAGTLTLPGLLAKRGLAVRADLLVPWTRWITPEAEPRRFDTWFFAAALPAGQEATGHLAEADKTAWLRPADAISAARAGTISLLPPTAATLNEFTKCGDLADILGRRRTVAPVQPRMVVEDGEAWLLIPDEVAYPL
jgi:8-oxo-dGTP pyrophosphatase MutT (NUDIX family)